ncbi:HAD-IA family hydrolase [Propionivibrio limicola]|uniref:HAD-IA family hydrolase n=1 Tax=Propionivibrio limicola TaxID=167645 RepID=UPI001290AF7F|nr:HAD-IA family hydrolase [Propionivibrio limicola]
MARRFDLLVFDWDGTLLDSTAAIVCAVQAACRDLSLPEPSSNHAKQAIGLGLAEALRHSAPDLEEAHLPLFMGRYKHHYLSLCNELSLFDGAKELVEELFVSGFTLAVATGKSRGGLERALEQSGMRHFFAATRCADECFSKPHPQMLEELMEELSASAERTLMIGDTTHDLQMAVNAGASGLAVAYGAHSSSVLDALDPLARLNTVGELSRWLRSNA